ncbi:MAG: spore cortex biosynthesis protein YabQ [Oscillospiraceae bacterium]
MELYIRLQVQTIAAALALGAAAVLVYELLRTVRLNRRRRWVTHLTDGVYVLAAFWALLRFTLSIGQGSCGSMCCPAQPWAPSSPGSSWPRFFGACGSFGGARRRRRAAGCAAQ